MSREQLLDKLVSEYFSTRHNLNVAHSPQSIFFFSCSGAGKSTTRRFLVNKLSATYVCNDEVRTLLDKNPEALSKGISLKAVVDKTLEKILTESANQMIIYDNNIILYYMNKDGYLNIARGKIIPIFIIGIEATEKGLVDRIKARGVNVSQILSELPAQIKAYDKATKDIAPDWILNTQSGDMDREKLASSINVKRTYSKNG